jgi:mannose-6-phosphate isomerase
LMPYVLPVHIILYPKPSLYLPMVEIAQPTTFLKWYLMMWTFQFGVGGENKANSSSWILQDWKAPKTERAWGYYRVLHEVGANTKLKELTVMPKTCLSMQRHDQRAEFWFVAEGEAAVYTLDAGTDHDLVGNFKKHDYVWIKKNQWHMLCNETDTPLKLIEIQYGENCVEEDIERKK